MGSMQHLRVPVTWTAEQGHRRWVAKLIAPARDTPLGLALAVVALVFCGYVAAASVDVGRDRWGRLSLLTALCANGIWRPLSRVIVLMRCRRTAKWGALPPAAGP